MVFHAGVGVLFGYTGELMIGLTSMHRLFFHRSPTDMRKSLDGLCGLVKAVMKRDPQSGDVYVFVNRRSRLLKALLWDRTGFVLFYIRLEVGMFELPPPGEPTWAQMVMMLEGAELNSARHRRRYASEG